MGRVGLKKVKSEDTDNGQRLISALTRFGLELYKAQVKEENSGNVFMSPLGIFSVLNMALLGARGRTWDEMKTAMFFDSLKVDSELHQAFSNLISDLKRCSTKEGIPEYNIQPLDLFQLHMTNKIYGEESYKILDEFQALCGKYYDSGLDPVSFINDPDKAVAHINAVVQEQTNKNINDIISPDLIDAASRLILVNAIYFTSAWSDRFPKHLTTETDFFVSASETLRVKMMHRTIKRAFHFKSRHLNCKVLKLHFLYGALSIFILLPDKTSTLGALEAKLTAEVAEHLHCIDSGFNRDTDVKLWLPKFKIEETMELSEILQQMGMTSLFDKVSADLSGIDGSRRLYASKMVHKAFIGVEEDGTEAAAGYSHCTGPQLRGAPQPLEKVDFRADRPFMFYIREERTKAVLFLGRVIRPDNV